MKQLFCTFFCLILAAQSLFAQKISAADALVDLQYLARVLAAHPSNLDTPVVCDGLLEAARYQKNDSITGFEHRLMIGAFLQRARCVHTQVIKNPLASNQEAIFPYHIAIDGQRCYLSDTTRSQGQEISAINGVPMRDIFQKIQPFVASDGGTPAFMRAFMQKEGMAPLLIARWLGSPAQYKISTPQGDTTVMAQKKLPALAKYPPLQGTQLLATSRCTLLAAQGNTMILRLKSFKRKDIRTYRRAFKHIKAQNATNLILDLRENGGGSRNAAVQLTRHMAQRRFGYTIRMQRGLGMLRQLNAKGKGNFMLSKVYYALGSPLHIRIKRQATEVKYRYKGRRNNWQGKVIVLTDGGTASSSTMVLSWLKQTTQTVHMGTQPGGGASVNYGGAFPSVTLPKSKMKVRVPVYRLSYDQKNSQVAGYWPDVVVERSAFGNRDAVLEAALKEAGKVK